MSHFAKIENNIVTQVIVAEQDFIGTLDGEWIQTSYNTLGNEHKLGGTPLRGNYAGIGFTYNREHDVFYSQSPFPSWVLNQSTWLWESPTPKPDDGKMYHWVEETTSWVEIV